MKIKILFLLITILLNLNCQSKEEQKPTQSKKDDINKTISLIVDDPILIQDSIYIIYPLILGHVEIEKSSYDYGSGSRDRITFYSNLIFLNTTTNAYHLLDEDNTMVIKFNAIPMENSKPDDPSSQIHFNKFDKWLYYSVTVDDFNGDGKLDSSDPSYLFISDKSGKDFKQISPKDVDIRNWRLIKGTNKIIMEGKKDSNNNKIFDSEDEIVPYSFIISKDKEPKEIFSEEFRNNIKKKFRKN